jgi:predicted deacylase
MSGIKMAAKWKITKHRLQQLVHGDELSLSTYTLGDGTNNGPHVYIQSSVHGSEVQGNLVILKLMELLSLEKKIKGKITLVPFVNPIATNNKIGTYTLGRYNPVTGHNWNRNFVNFLEQSKASLDKFVKKNLKEDDQILIPLFKKFLQNEMKIFNANKQTYYQHLNSNLALNFKLQQMAAMADVVIDLHTGPVACDYLYTPTYDIQNASYLNIKNILLIPEICSGAMDEASFIPWVELKNSFANYGRDFKIPFSSFTMEVGSEEVVSAKKAESTCEGIINFLRFKQVLTGKPVVNRVNTCVLQDFKTLYAPVGGLLDYHMQVGTKFRKGDIFGTLYQFKNLNPSNVSKNKIEFRAETDGILINQTPTSIVTQGMELWQFMTNISSYKSPQ